MKNKIIIVCIGTIVAVAVQTIIAIAETLSFGPSLHPLTAIFGPFTFPIVTAITLGIPIAALYYNAFKLLNIKGTLSIVLLISPFALLQILNVQAAALNLYAFIYPVMLVSMSLFGAWLSNKNKHA